MATNDMDTTGISRADINGEAPDWLCTPCIRLTREQALQVLNAYDKLYCDMQQATDNICNTLDALELDIDNGAMRDAACDMISSPNYTSWKLAFQMPERMFDGVMLALGASVTAWQQKYPEFMYKQKNYKLPSGGTIYTCPDNGNFGSKENPTLLVYSEVKLKY